MANHQTQFRLSGAHAVNIGHMDIRLRSRFFFCFFFDLWHRVLPLLFLPACAGERRGGLQTRLSALSKQEGRGRRCNVLYDAPHVV